MDHRSDLFSLGSVLYAMCTGRPPFRATTVLDAIRRVCEDAPRPIRRINQDIPDWLVEIIDKLLAKDANERFQSSAEVAELLGQHLAHLEQPDVVPQPARLPRPVRSAAWRRWRPLGMVVAALLVLFAGLGLTEATGITALTPTIIRVLTPKGTLVIEVDDPDVKIALDGQEVIIEGGGPQQIRLRPGTDRLRATKDGEAVREQLVTVTRGGKQTVSVSLEPPPPALAVNGPPSEPTPVTVRIRPIGTLRGHVADVRKVAFAPDGRTLATASWDHTVGLWDLSRKQVRATLEGHTQGVNCIAFRPDGKMLASSGLDGLVNLWDVAKGKGVAALNGHTDWALSVAFDADGRTLASASCDRTVKVWDVASRALLISLDVDHECVEPVAFSPDGKVLAAGSWNGAVRAWDRATWKEQATFQMHKAVKSMAFAPDGRILASSGVDGTIRLWDTDAERLLFAVKGRHAGQVWTAAFSPDGKTLATGGEDSTVKLWEVAVIPLPGKKQPGLPFEDERATEDQRMAERVLWAGGKVVVVVAGGRTLAVDQPAELPESFAVAAIDLRGDKLSLGALPEIARLDRLDQLHLANTLVTDQELDFSAGPPKLTVLDLSLTRITDATLAQMGGCPGLRRLLLCGTAISDEGLRQLAKLTHLEELDLSGCQISDAGLEVLGDLPALKRLVLDHTGVTDAGLAHLADLSQIKHLSLVHTRVSDAGLAHLRELAALEEARLVGTQVTTGGVEALRQGLPRCKLQWQTDPVDLLGLIDPQRDTLEGQWNREGKTLVSGQGASCRLQVPYASPDEYDLALTVERLRGHESIHVGIVVGGRQCWVVVDGWPAEGHFSGLQFVDGQWIPEREDAYHGRVLPNETPVTILCEVRGLKREYALRVVCGGRVIYRWHGDPWRLSSSGEGTDWAPPKTEGLCLCSWRDAFRISQIQLTPISETGKPARDVRHESSSGQAARVFSRPLAVYQRFHPKFSQIVEALLDAHSRTIRRLSSGPDGSYRPPQAEPPKENPGRPGPASLERPSRGAPMRSSRPPSTGAPQARPPAETDP